MSSGIASLYKILKDDTRKRIIVLINENGSLSYTDLLGKLEVVSTGLLNYHLKVLRDLLNKNEAGQYTLSEKGRLASRLLEEFPEQEYQLQKRKRQKKFWLAASASQVVYLTIVLTLYYLNYISIGQLAVFTIWFVGSIALAYLGYRLQDKAMAPGIKEAKNYTIGYIVLGCTIGFAITFFGTPLASYLSASFGGPNLMRIIDFHVPEYVSILAIAALTGGFGGYFIGKKQAFRQPKWGKWLEEHGP
jgi:DNA-binding transcriptional ArsR family regulator